MSWWGGGEIRAPGALEPAPLTACWSRWAPRLEPHLGPVAHGELQACITEGLVAWYSPPGRCLNQPGFLQPATSAWPARWRSRAVAGRPPSGDVSSPIEAVGSLPAVAIGR